MRAASLFYGLADAARCVPIGCHFRRWTAVLKPTLDGAAADASAPTPASPARLFPPGAAATADKVLKFRRSVESVLFRRGEELQCQARGAAAVRQLLQAFVFGKRTVDFEVKWAGAGIGSAGGDRALCFAARAGEPWEDYMRTRFTDVPGFPVRSDTQVLQLARAVAQEERKTGALRVHALLKDEAAIGVLAKALATAPSIQSHLGHRRLFCTPNIVKGGDRSRVFVYVRGKPAEQVPIEDGVTFVAVPPGADADASSIKAFTLSVHDRLCRGEIVDMECRGPHAVGHAVRAFCELQGYTVEFESSWTDSSGPVGVTGVAPQLHVLALRATRGQSWDMFNSTDFSNAARLFSKSSTTVHKLAYAVAKEVHKSSIAVIHTYSDNLPAVSNAIKVLATAPTLAGGERIISVPSFGRAGQQRRPTLRLVVRRYQRSESRTV